MATKQPQTFVLPSDKIAERTMRRMRALVLASARDARVVETAREICRDADPRSFHEQAIAIREWMKLHFRFIRDPRNVELLAAPPVVRLR